MSGCRTARRRLLALLDGRLDLTARTRVKKHLSSCEPCAEAFERMKQARAATQQIDDGSLPEVNYRQVEAQVRWRLARRPSARSKMAVGRPIALMALAATLAIGGVIGALLFGAYNQQPPALVVQPIVKKAVPKPPAKPIELAALPNLVQGKVLVATEDGVIAPLSLSRPVLPGERLITEQGEAALQWDKGSGLRLQPASEVKLAQLTNEVQALVLLRGRVDIQAAKRPPSRRIFAVVGGGIRATVKGTAFSVSLGDHSAKIVVDEGVVVVGPTGQHSWSEVLLATGQRQRLEGGAVELRAGEQLEAVAGGVPKIERIKARPRPSLNLQAQWKNLHRLIATSGALLIESKPNGAEVHIDSVVLGQTNLSARGSIGRHLVEVWRGDRLLRREWVQVGAASSTRVKVARPPTARLPKGLYQVFRSRIPLIRACYERQLKRTPKLAGRFTLRISIDADGKVNEAKLDLDTLAEPQVGRCALAVVRRWTFPPGQAAEVVYPFVFQPDE